MPRNEARVYELRAKGHSKAHIGRVVQCSKQRVSQLLAESSPFEVDLRPAGRIVLFNSEEESNGNSSL